MLLVYSGIAWLTGIFIGSFLKLPLWALLPGLLPFLLVFFFRQHRKQITLACVCLFALLGGAVRYDSAATINANQTAQNYTDKGVVEIRGTVSAAPDIRDTYAQIILKVTGIKSADIWQTSEGKVLVFASLYPEYAYGDSLTIQGTLTTPQQVDEFDYPGYLADQGIFSLAVFPEVTSVERHQGFSLLGSIYKIRVTLAQKLAEVLPEPQASLAQGILLGIRGNIPPALQKNFTITGTTHILAISGVNLNILSGILVATGAWLFGKRRQVYIWLALTAIWAYALLTGVEPPVVRAAFIVSLFLCADLLGRQHSLMTGLALAAGIMTAITPRVLWDVSFQLSFLAMLALVYVVPYLQNTGKNLVTTIAGEEGIVATSLKWITDSFSVTLGVTLVVWPLLARYFGVFSIVSPVATLLILPVLPAIMLFSALSAIGGLIFLPLGTVLGWVAWLFLSYMLAVIDSLAKLPAAALQTSSIHPLVVIGYFVILTAVVLLAHRSKKSLAWQNRFFYSLSRIPLKWVLPPLTVLVVLSTAFVFTLPDKDLHVSYLDVGQGDAILIQMGNQDILIDGGPSRQALNRELGKKMPFWDRTIELVIVTHPHADHLTGLIDAVSKYRVQQVLEPMTNSVSPLWLEWEELVTSKKIKVTSAQTGQTINLTDRGISLDIIHAPESLDGDSLDNEGIVLRLSDGKVSFLFTADISATTETELLMSRAPLKSTVLKVPHHGSEYGTSGEFLAVVEPVIAVISVGANNEYGHPAKETLLRLSGIIGQEHIYRTDLNGTITLTTNGENLWLTKDR
ncbi:MAG: DNA internalization-related competence protein ComEC/Rec2 [Dehalococcoidales bacterium]|nr:DNA internalization-related competence protein ComEC/Rec2 [Dehalococcoidales bacterium]